ncbi:MAG: DUF4349 domain-containing protein [Clostridia bacterium]|nr:DUF4349 domain-containing protein [Clostridia bacterium]
MRRNIFTKWTSVLLCLLCLCLFFASCAKASNGSDMEKPNSSGGSYDEAGKGEIGFTDVNVSVDSSQVAERKVIKTFDISTETKEFDAALEALNALIAEKGGYVESASMNNQSLNYSSATYTRYASFTIRVPAEYADAFVGSMGEMFNITSNRSYVEDVSETYYSIEARLEELKVERDSLLDILNDTATKKDYNFWLTVKQRLSEVTQQIAVYQGQLNRYDGKIAFSTINLSVREVLTYSAVSQNNRFGSRLGAAFKEGWNDFVIGLQDFAIWLAEALPTLVLLAGIGTGIGFLIRAIRRKKKKARIATATAVIGETPKKED